MRPRLLQSPAAAAAAASVTAAYAIVTATDEKNIAMRNSVNPDVKNNEIETVQKLSAIDTDTLKAEKKLLESSIMQARDENSRLQTKIDEMNITHTELLKVKFQLEFSKLYWYSCSSKFLLFSSFSQGTSISAKSTYS